MEISDCKVLVVDDEVDLADLMAESFELEGFSVEKATSAEEALERCEANRYDVIVSDQNMPGVSGFQLLEKLNSNLKNNFLFYLCTGDIDIELENFKKTGGTDLVSKPYDLFSLIERVGEDLKEI